MTSNSVRICPQCGSAHVDFSELVGGAASCLGCKWSGTADELLLIKGASDVASAVDGKIEGMVNDLRRMLAGELGLPYLKFLLKWGFLAGDVNNLAATLDRKKFSRYLVAIAKAVLEAIIAERAHQAVEDVPVGLHG